ncbi:hypothetical protein A3Q56_04241, partial [Intoshia linei]
NKLTYSIYNQFDQTFEVIPHSGAIVVRRKLDFEAEQKVYKLRYRVFDEKFSNFTEIEIKVTDVNDNAPVFDQDVYTVENILEEDDSITKNSPKFLLQVKATDPDIERNSEIVYALTGQFAESAFNIDKYSGNIYLLKPLDRDKPFGRPIYNVNVLAYDEPNSSFSMVGYSEIRIILTDINDNEPQFNLKRLDGYIMENKIGPIDIIRVEAKDADFGNNAQVKYKINENVDMSYLDMPLNEIKNLFKIDKDSGWISSRFGTKFDRENIDKYTFSVRAYDQGYTHSNYNNIWVTIHVDDDNDNVPKFGQSLYEVEMYELFPIGSNIITISASDSDIDENAQLTYTISEENRNFFIIESIAATNQGVLKVAKSVDYENLSQRFFNISVRVHDSNEQKFDTARIEVTVLDSNDMAPRFASDYITRKVKENIPIGTVIAQFFAVDGDTGINSEFTYQFDPISQESKLFSIDSVSGKLENINYLDREIQSHFIISVYAVDRGIPSLNSTATLDLTLDDVNDSYPRFSKSYNPIIMENTDPSNFKFVVEAVDDDSVINGPPFIFSLPCFGKCPCSLLPTFCGLFNLKFIPNNGVNDNQAIITVNSKEPFDREEVKFYNLLINISDSGLPVQWGFNILKITIGDENDNEHSSGTKNIKFYNYKGSFKDVFIGTVYSKDPDDWDAPEKLHKLIKVSPSEVKTKFKVTSLGYIFTSGILSPKIYTLDVEVTDPTFGLTVTSKVVVDVLDLNDEFLINSGSMLIENTDAIEFIQEDNVSESKLTTFKKFMSKKLSFPIDSILVFSIMNYDSNPKLCEKCIQVFYAVKNSPWQKPERLDSIVNHYKSELESLDIIVLMSPIDNCRTLNFNPCTLNSEIVTPCYKELRIHETEPQNVVNANKTSFIGLNVYYEYHCKSKVPERYVTGKFCPTLYCLNGGRCVKVFGKYECECIGGFSGPRCQQTFISFSLSNPEQIDASFTVLEPFNIDSKHIVNLDFMTKRENGILLFNNGNVQKLNIHFPKLQELNSLQVRKYYYQNYLSQMEKKRQNNYCSLLLYLKNGFVILKLFDSNNVFSVDMSSNDLTKKLNDGIWHSIKIIFMEKSVSVIIDDCENLKDLSSQTVDVSSCMNFIDIPKYKRIFASPHPVYLGGIYLDNDSNDSNLKRILNFLKTENVNSYSGCIKNVYHNDWIKDLHVGNRGFGKNIKDGCPDAFLSCGFKPGLLGSFTKVGYCGQNAYCTGSMIDKHWCTCKSGWTGENCSQETNQVNFLDNSVIEWRHNIETPLLGFFNNAFVSKLQLSFRTRQNSGLLFSAEFADQYLRLDIINDNIRIRAQLSNGRIISANMDHYFISDGMWHNIIVKRIGHVIIINADDGQIHYSVNMYSHNNIYSSDTLKFNTPSTKFLAGAQIDDIMIYNDYRDSCINDVRFMDVNFEIHLKQSDVVAEKIKTVLIKNVKMGCISNVCNSSHPSYTECIEPLQCFDLWRLKDCRCGEGFELNSSPNKKLTCLNVNECLTFSPCHYGTCIDTVPGFSCTCEDDYTGELCNAQAIRMLEISGVSISIIVIVVLILLIVAISLLLITQRRRYRKKLVNEKEENYNCQKFVDYDVEAADEEDTNNFDLSKLRKPINTISNIVDGQGNKISPSEIEKRLQNDKPTPSEDSLLTFHHSTECHDSDDNLSYISELSFQKINVSGVIENLKNFGPKFANIAKLYHHSDQENHVLIDKQIKLHTYCTSSHSTTQPPKMSKSDGSRNKEDSLSFLNENETEDEYKIETSIEDEYYDDFSNIPTQQIPQNRSNLPVALNQKKNKAMNIRAQNIHYENEMNFEIEWPKVPGEITHQIHNMQSLGALKSFDAVPNYQRINITGEESSPTYCTTTERLIQRAILHKDKTNNRKNRNYYAMSDKEQNNYDYYPSSTEKNKDPNKNERVYQSEMIDGIMHVYYTYPSDDKKNFMECPLIKWKEFVTDYKKMRMIFMNGPLKTYCFTRLSALLKKFQFHILLNEFNEQTEQKMTNHRDFYNVRKVDTHVHAASCMNQKHLLRFIKHKLKADSEKIVAIKDGKEINITQLFKDLELTSYNLSVDTLDVHADRHTFHRFDRFAAKYNPVGLSSLRTLFLKTQNHINGEYFAELIKEVALDLDENKYQMQELRISIYGRHYEEFENLANWFVNFNMKHDCICWLIQLPRLYDIYKENDSMPSFHHLLKNVKIIFINVFHPLFEATLYPDKHKNLSQFLMSITGFDSVDDESKQEYFGIDSNTSVPENWKSKYNPPYCYYIYYMYANILQLNHLRRSKGLNTLVLRPHSGESGNVIHLMTTYMLSQNISHGLNLRKAPVLQYLFYLAQVNIAMSPLSNNSLFLDYHRNPFQSYMMQGIPISLSTDDPLQFHFTKEPLIEEYSIATQVWKLSSVDMCELARNSVLMSSFPHETKKHWLGNDYLMEGVKGNNISQTNVPSIRVEYRYETLLCELSKIMPFILSNN